MTGYTKLFHSILASTIWREDLETRVVWITMLAMADKEGVVDGSVPGLADFARISVEATRAALVKLSGPDPDSRSPELDGRRIVAIPGGWQLVNHAKYRAKMGADERREYLRLKKREERDQRKCDEGKRVNAVSTRVNKRRDVSTLSTHTEAEADADADAKYLLPTACK